MTEQPRDWDKELAKVDCAMAQQPVAPVTPPVTTIPTASQRRFVALAWFWAVVAVVLAVALLVWPYDRSCGIRLIFFLGASLLALIMGVLGAFSSWAHRQGLAMLISLLVIVWAGVMTVREILPRTGYAKEAMEWT